MKKIYLLLEISKDNFTWKKLHFYWKYFTGIYELFLLDKKIFFTGQKEHENFTNILEKMIFITGRFIHSHILLG